MRAWVHEENSRRSLVIRSPQCVEDLDESNQTIKIRKVLHSGSEESEPKNGDLTVQQQLNEGAAENAVQETETSEDELHPGGLEDIIDWPDVDNKKHAPGNKSNGGAIPKKMPTSNQSTPRTARKGAPKHDWSLEQYLREANAMTQEISKSILTWCEDKSVDGGRKWLPP